VITPPPLLNNRREERLVMSSLDLRRLVAALRSGGIARFDRAPTTASSDFKQAAESLSAAWRGSDIACTSERGVSARRQVRLLLARPLP
jgi:hypothetical protein